jgi:hypothetical protein
MYQLFFEDSEIRQILDCLLKCENKELAENIKEQIWKEHYIEKREDE